MSEDEAQVAAAPDVEIEIAELRRRIEAAVAEIGKFAAEAERLSLMLLVVSRPVPVKPRFVALYVDG